MRIKLLSITWMLFTFALVAQDKQLSLSDIWASGKFQSQGIYGIKPSNNGSTYTAITFGDNGPEIALFAYKNQKKLKTIISQSDAKWEGENISLGGYQFSGDEKKLILGKGVESIYRRSSKGHYFMVDVATKKITPVSDPSADKISHPTFSPSGKKVAYVQNNNLYIYDVEKNEQIQVTGDGKQNEIINGMCDWVYEEEFSFTRAFEWSPNEEYIAYYKFNETEVPTYTMRYYGSLYPELYAFKYPKAGEKNAEVSIHLYNLTTGKGSTVDIGAEKDQYIPRIKWIPGKNSLCVYRMNRLQNKLELLNINPENGSSKSFYTESSDTYVEVTDNLFFLEDGNSFFITTEKEGFNQIYWYNTNGKPISKITTTKWDVTQVYGVDTKGWIYFQGVGENPTKREIYKINKDNLKLERLTEESGMSDADFSSDFSLFIHHYKTANQPERVYLKNNRGKTLETLEDNKSLSETLKSYNLSPKDFFTFKTERGDELHGYMIMPENFDASKKYPVYMTCYNGPGINRVNDAWEGANQLWLQYLAQEGYLVVCVDGRGTGYRGAAFKKCTYGQLGKLETEDQISAAKHVAKMPFADPNRISMQGWSYGG
ncbi:MAG: DPP IV N-terminal domain-containing protein, partial [Luteibaculum sp.]